MSMSPVDSREVTPSTVSASPPSTQPSLVGMDRPISGGSSSGADSQGGDKDDADKFRRRVELEQTMQVLQQRLELANLKAKNGWTGMTINEIENKLPPAPRRRREDMRVVTGLADPSGSNMAYEPPSPSRPWQLVDVLWQPLPPPSRSYPHSPHSPGSPLKRARDEDDAVPRSSGPSHQRRASGSNHHLSPADHVRRREKQRSQSHSHTRLRPTTQDFNAAQALTEMLSGSPSSAPSSSFRRGSSDASLAVHRSLPLPPAFDHPPRRSSSAAPVHRASRKSAIPDDEDKDAAELMMFLAQSPSASTRPSGSTSPPRNLGSTARVLFADEKESDGHQRREERSNLSSATPITATDQNGFGALL